MDIFGRKGNELPPSGPVEANPNWRTYRAGEWDKAGRKIRRLHALDDDYVIYFIGCDLYYETVEMLGEDLGSADAALARINRLLAANPTEGTREYEMNVSTLELAADAFEMFFCGEKTEALEILNGIRDKLQAKEEAQRRLTYQAGTALVTVIAWIFYLLLHRGGSLPVTWEPWILTAALAMAGGLFSVCLTIGSLEVNVNQNHSFLFVAGATRSVVAFLSGIALLLAMRSKMFAGITYNGDPPNSGDALRIAEMFFCFLAGFSESFVPNILRDSENKPNDKKLAAAVPREGQPEEKKHPAPVPNEGQPDDKKPPAAVPNEGH